jgi:hypothetical protein
MNQRYVFRYLEDPKDAFGELNDPARVQMIVNKDLPEDDPVAYAFMGALTLDEDQLNDLESTINEVGEPLEGARRCSEDNSEVWPAPGPGRRERARVLRKDLHTTLHCAGVRKRALLWREAFVGERKDFGRWAGLAGL